MNNSSKDVTEKVIEYQMKLHKSNKRRIKIGLRFLLVVPIFFMTLMFLTGSSKLIFLVLFIASLFGISIYLMAIEYADYNIQKRISEIYGLEDREIEKLIDYEDVLINRIISNIELQLAKEETDD